MPTVSRIRNAQQVLFVVGKLRDIHDLPVRHDVYAVRVIRVKRQVHRERLVREDDARAELALVVEHVRKQVAPVFLVIFARVLRLDFQALRNERIAVHLPVRVRHRDAHRLAAVFKREHVLDLFVRLHDIEALAPQIDQLAHVRVGQFRQRRRVARGVEDEPRTCRSSARL